MAEKKIHISAIIPEHLYVSRDADRKLQEVIKRMSKPAYVSVSRQMGKTNLLIHTKRKLEDDRNRYVFIDITNKFQDTQDCFRYIVDQVLDANEHIEGFQQAADRIQKTRQKLSTNPTKEYQQELREILKCYSGNLVIFLDEVDDLRKHDFSDDVFAQVRKTYFLRVTYPEFERLSYVLSGVIDPEKLIRNKENSPFNIAIPIYLDDFTKDEFHLFVKKADIDLTSEVQDHIYSWLNGNPRMTFDVLSRIEDEQLGGKEINIQIVDSVISNIYLENFKHPPVDHIRDLVKHNTEVRRAVIQLKNGNGNSLSDEAKNKLYLFGIIASRISTSEPMIKNKVIECCLSSEWLEQIELEKKGYYDLAKDKIAQELYDEGIRLMKEFLQNSPPKGLVPLAKYSIGEAYHKLEKYEMSNQYLTERPVTIDFSPQLYYSQAFYIGINYFKAKDFENAIKNFNEIISDSKNPELIAHGLFNKAESMLAKGDFNFADHELLYSQALQILLNESEIRRDELLYLTYYRLGYIYFEQKDLPKAAEYFEKALENVSVAEKPLILLYLDACYKDDIEKRKEFHIRVADVILTNKLGIRNKNTIIPLDFSHVYVCLSNLVDFGYIDKFNELFQYTHSELYDKSISRSRLNYELGKFNIELGDTKIAITFLERIHEDPSSEPQLLAYSYQILGILAHNQKETIKAAQFLEKYVALFDRYENFNEPLSTLDGTVFTTLINYFRSRRDYERSYQIANIILKHYSSNIGDELKASFVFVKYYVVDYYIFSGKVLEATSAANEVLQLINEIKPRLNELSFADKEGLDVVQQRIRKFLSDSNFLADRILPIRVEREKGRNEWVKVRYKNGAEVLGKFKKFKDDIANGECVLLDE